MNFIARLQAYIKTLPPFLQSAFYTVETGAAVAIGIYGAALFAALNVALSGKPFVFDFAAENKFLYLSLAAAVVKAVLEAVKAIGGTGPTQQPALIAPVPNTPAPPAGAQT